MMKLKSKNDLLDPDKRGRLWREERVVESQIQSEESHGWAVSYSDLLMVLMSFFIIFFSAKDDEKPELISEIAMSLKNGEHSQETSSTSEAENATEKQQAQAVGIAIADIKNSFASNDMIALESQPMGLKISFLEDLFLPRKFSLNEHAAAQMDSVLDRLKEHQDKILIYFVGHTDSKVVSQLGDAIADNFTLSSMRANSALKYALAKGFKAENLNLQGSADNFEKFRTLSVEIRIKPLVSLKNKNLGH